LQKKLSKKDEIDDEDESGGEEVWHCLCVLNLHITTFSLGFEVSISSLTMTWKIQVI
jgi:hypothetical protein